ncbi:MAG: class I SAM-dependent RNA methyltransferase [Anaerolineae bacterium]
MPETTMPQDGHDFELELTTMAHGGSALGRHEGRPIFVPYAIPGERITAQITHDHGRYANAEGVLLLDSSPDRVAPRCPHFGPGRCGGCQWQHIAYEAQLRYKQQVVQDQLARIGGLRNVNVLPTLPSPDPWSYRAHVTFHVAPNGTPGFVATDNQTVIPIDECHIIRPELMELLLSLDYESLDAAQTITRIKMQVGSASDDLLIAFNTVDDEPPSLEIDLPLTVAFLGEDEHPQPLIGTGKVSYTIHDKTFQVTAGSFFQVNQAMAEKLVELVLARASLNGRQRVLDLYCGVGLFSAFLAENAREVVAIEGFPTAVDDADVNLEGCENVTLIEGLVEAVLPELDGHFDVVVLDPPRAGMENGAADALAALGPKQIIYVSCDPATLARDAKHLAARGYHLQEVQPVDMFPQTYHIECVATFTR